MRSRDHWGVDKLFMKGIVKNYAINVGSIQDKGTKVTILIPVCLSNCKDNEDEEDNIKRHHH